MTRPGDWLPRLRDAIEAETATPFAWGRHDCCLSVSSLIEAMTGTDPARPLRGYKTERGALGKLRRFAGADVPPAARLEATAAGLAARAGYVEVPPLRAQRGDVALALPPGAGSGEEVLALVDITGRGLITAGRDGGWVVFPLACALRAWRV